MWSLPAFAGLPYGVILVLGGGLLISIFWGMFVETIYGRKIRNSLHKGHETIKEAYDSYRGTNFGTADELVPVDEEGGHTCHIRSTGESYVLSSQTVIVQV